MHQDISIRRGGHEENVYSVRSIIMFTSKCE